MPSAPTEPMGSQKPKRRKGPGKTMGQHNVSARVSKKGGAALELSGGSKPSRKSTRGSSGHIKRTTNQQLKAVNALHSPEHRAASANAKAKAVRR
jgi:hypothetical protein